jgi:hypothetical protein
MNEFNEFIIILIKILLLNLIKDKIFIKIIY